MLSHLTMMGRECSSLDPSYQRHITSASTGCYRLHPYHPLCIVTPTYRRYQFIDPEKMNRIAWSARAKCTHITFIYIYIYIYISNLQLGLYLLFQMFLRSLANIRRSPIVRQICNLCLVSRSVSRCACLLLFA